MIGNKEFFEELRNGDEYLNCFMTKEVYSGIEQEYRERIVVNTVRKKNIDFQKDETHKQLIRDVSKAKKELIKYEFKINY
jgi:hypothetical protein